MSSGKPTRDQADLAEVLEMVLDKGIVINADIAITVGETELLGIELRAAIASFETAAKYGLAFPSGTDMRRVERASGRESLEGEDGEPIDLGIDASSGGSRADDKDDEDDESGRRAKAAPAAPSQRPTPQVPTEGDDGDTEGDETESGNGTPDEQQSESADRGDESETGSTDESDQEDA